MAEQPKGGGITWTNTTWNPIRGCSRVSKGCQLCYAERMAARFSGPGQPYEGLAEMKEIVKPQPASTENPWGYKGVTEPRWTGKIAVIEDRIQDPIRWKRPRMVFVNSMSDLFHEGVTDETIDRIFTSMALAPKHIFQVLTKRPERMQKYMARLSKNIDPLEKCARKIGHTFLFENLPLLGWPIRNVWLGVSVEDQETANYRIPLLLQTQAEIRWVSYEPALGPVDFLRIHYDNTVEINSLTGDHGVYRPLQGKSDSKLDWIVVGGESGPGARPFHVNWARNTVTQGKAAGVPVFVKQLGAFLVTDGMSGPGEHWPDAVGDLLQEDTGQGTWRRFLRDSHGADMEEWAEDLRVREFPKPLALSS